MTFPRDPDQDGVLPPPAVGDAVLPPPPALRSSTAVPTGDTGPPFVPISVTKLVLLSVATFGIYEVVWFYRHWRRVRESTGENLWPFWRAVLAPIFSYRLFQRVIEVRDRQGVGKEFSPGWLTLGYIAFLGAAQLQDPYFLVSLLSFIPLAQAQAVMHRANVRALGRRPAAVQWGVGGLLALLLGGAVWILFLVSLLVPLDDTAPGVSQDSDSAVSEAPASVAPDATVSDEAVDAPWVHALTDSHRAYMEELGLIDSNEEVLAFYSAGDDDVREDGNLVTDRGVVSYQDLGVDVELLITARYEEIRRVAVAWGDEAKDTRVRITLADETQFLLLASPEDGRDRELVRLLRRAWRAVRTGEPAGAAGE